jgi:ribosomal protein S27E
MAIEDRIECRGCGRAVVPQLWVDTRDRMSHPKVRHLCPLCGATLRVSGGGINRGMLALVIGSFGMLILMLIFVVMKYGR